MHCGFCTATCPTYQLLGDELDGPRGRIYLIKQALEGGDVTAKTQLHLDRCLTCRSCETTCPSGVRYGRLVDIGRKFVDDRVGRAPVEAAKRSALRRGLLVEIAVRRGADAWPLREAVAAARARESHSRCAHAAGAWPAPRHARTRGDRARAACSRRSRRTSTRPPRACSTAMGISAIAVEGGGCCGALSYHLSEHDEARALARRNIDAWWPHVERGAEAIVVTASGCGVMVRDYGTPRARSGRMRTRPRASPRSRAIRSRSSRAAWSRPAAIASGPRARSARSRSIRRARCSTECKIRGAVERLLAAVGLHARAGGRRALCCGSAGTYSILQPELAGAAQGEQAAGAPRSARPTSSRRRTSAA